MSQNHIIKRECGLLFANLKLFAYRVKINTEQLLDIPFTNDDYKEAVKKFILELHSRRLFPSDYTVEIKELLWRSSKKSILDPYLNSLIPFTDFSVKVTFKAGEDSIALLLILCVSRQRLDVLPLTKMFIIYNPKIPAVFLELL
ncbi:MAG TPA: hypothetical protein VJG90_08715 [Candidatus Nanoarchaeia archaeon]|nr:hypothetical protein [Candidatus Nanoarchaeia archaeon]